MTTDDSQFNLELSRRKLFTEAGIAGGAVVAAPVVGSVAAQAMNTPLQVGADASSEMVASWHTLQPVRNPRVMLGTLEGKLDRIVGATGASYIDAK